MNGDDIDIVNQWKAVEGAGGKKPSRPMKHYYADVTVLFKPFMKYTYAM